MVEPVENPANLIQKLTAELTRQDGYWGSQEKLYAETQGAGSAARWEAGQIRRLLDSLIKPKLTQISALSPQMQSNLLNLMVPFDAEGGIRGFLLHFFQIVEDPQGNLVFQERDSFEREVYILYDLYKVKKTMEVIQVLQKAIRDPAKRFPSVYSPEEQEAILTQLNQVMNLLFTQCLPPHHRHDLISNLSPAYLTRESVENRRKAGLVYSYPHVLNKYDYRRFFFLIYFKEGFKAKMGEQEREFRFNFLKFQALKKEYLLNWMTQGLKNHPNKFKMYSKIVMRGKTLLAQIVDDPSRETALLQELPTPVFNDLVSQVNEQVAPDQKLDVEPESENFGPYKKLREQLTQAVAVAKSTLSTLKGMVESPPPEPVSYTPEPAPVLPADGKPVWQITLMNHQQIANPFFHNTLATYNTQLNLLRARMGDQYKPFAQYVSDRLESTPESVSVRRRTPKHEWTLPYHLRKISSKGTEDYLLVLGAEAKAKPKGMGYASKETYAFTPFFVLGATKPEEGFGDPVGERSAKGMSFQEYSFQQPAVIKTALELIQIIQEKSTRKPAAL